MIELSTAFVDPVSAPSLAPVEQSIDVAHLARMTLGDASLEREVLQLFDRQAEMLLARMQMAAAPAAAAAHAHTLKGSSSGIGAWKVARAAEAVELAASSGSADVSAAVADLQMAVAETRASIAELLRGH
jgi:hypothetical protein